MKHQMTLKLMEWQLRARICPHCMWRPAGSESLGADTLRSCQGQCEIFRNLPELKQMDSMLGSYEQTMRHGIRRVCARIPESARPATRQTGPLGHYRREVIEVLHALVRG